MLIPLKAVIFDYGNVLCGPQQAGDIEAMAGAVGVSPAVFEKAYWKDRLAFDEAAVTPEAYWSALGSAVSRGISDDLRGRLIELDNLSWSHSSPVMCRWASALRPAGIRTAVLSNMPVTLRQYLSRCCDWLPEFDFSCYSCDVRCAKPAAGIFRICLDGLGVDPGDALFLDDRPENVEAAGRLGIHVIQFRDAEQTQREIDGRYRLPLRIVEAAQA